MTLYLTSIDPVHLNIGSVLCSPLDIIPLARSFTARIIVFDIQVPITTGASVGVFCIQLQGLASLLCCRLNSSITQETSQPA